MYRRIIASFVLFLTIIFSPQALAYPTILETGARLWQKGKTFDGYTLVVPAGGVAKGDKQAPVFLVDMAGKEVHRWTLTEGLRATSAKILPDSTLFLVARVNGLDPGSSGSTIQELDWDGKVIWEYSTTDQWHHDVARLSNGNIAGLEYRLMTKANASRLKGGLAGTDDPVGVYQDVIVEVDRETKQIVWEWKPEDWLKVEDYPLGPLQTRKEWTHANAISYLPQGNALIGDEGFLVSFRQNDLVVAVSKKTKEVLWQFGPGVTSKQHDPSLLENGNVLIFDNGMHRVATTRYGVPSSRVIEVNSKTEEIVWEYLGNAFNGSDFLSPLWGGAQRLPNGNTLITEGMTGRIFEVDMTKDNGNDVVNKKDPRIVWEYVSPYVSTLPLGRTLSKATRYSRNEIDWPQSLSQSRFSDPVSGTDSSNLPIYLTISVLLNVLVIYLLFKRRG